MKTSQQIRQEFIEFFEQRGHRFVRSAPVAPNDDPTLLFTNSGMAQFKDIFLGTGTRDYKRAANSQKCIRASGKHNDLEDVGRDNYHHTFFEMLGNWSFGDYFKEDAIRWAWELTTGLWGLPKAQLWATVFEGGEGVPPDEEAETLWKQVTDINPDQVMRFDKHDNFWEMGEVGPCGPCSELHIDLGEGTCPLSEQHECQVNQDGCWRFVELWNLVFMQFQRFPDGHLEPLPAMHVDTGMGLERICRVMQGVDSNYATDLFTPLLKKIHEVTGVPDSGGEVGVAYRVVADHLRAVSFAVADGAIPSNEGRGYVLRRMLRRATRFGRVLGMHEPFIHKLVPTLAEVMGDAFPEIRTQQKHVMGVIEAEESSFGHTLDRGLEIFEQMVSQDSTRQSGILSGENAFKLYDTYGFPVDLTRLMCEERGLKVDEAEFEKHMEAQRTRAREAGKFRMTLDQWVEVTSGTDSRFVGYTETETESFIRRYTQDAEGRWMLILDTTPFYAESGGQVADQGTITQGPTVWTVVDVQKQGDAIVHICIGGGQPQATPVRAKIREDFRTQATNNHTATHLMYAAMQQVLGIHVSQAGSIVHPDYLRFDFTHFEKVSEEQLDEIERIVNDKIRENIDSNVFESPYQDAIDSGIKAMFGEKYGDVVRVVEVGEFSRELCGGCHVSATGQIGQFRITSESAIAAGVRRIMAVTGKQAEELGRQQGKVVTSLRQLLNLPEEQITHSVERLLEERRQLERELQQLRKAAAKSNLGDLLSEAQEISGAKVLARMIEVDSMDTFRDLGNSLREQIGSGVIWLGTILEGKGSLLCAVSDDLVGRGLKAGELVNAVAALADGRGGGKPQMAQAGIKSLEKLPEALQQAPAIAGDKLA
jgi:alanyl-tRNA synthetase